MSTQTWLMLPAEVGQGEAQGPHIQQQPGFELCNFGQAVGLPVALQLAGGDPPALSQLSSRMFSRPPRVLRAGSAFGDALGELPSSR